MTEAFLSPIWISIKTVLAATVITFFLGMRHAEGGGIEEVERLADFGEVGQV